MKRNSSLIQGDGEGGSSTVVMTTKRIRVIPPLRLHVVAMPLARSATAIETVVKVLRSRLQEELATERFKALVEAAHHMRLTGSMLDLAILLVGHAKVERDKIVLMKVIELLGHLAKHPSVSVVMVTHLLISLEGNASKKVRAQLLTALHSIVRAKPLPGLAQRVMQLAIDSLPIMDAVVRSRALLLLTYLADVAAVNEKEKRNHGNTQLSMGSLQLLVATYFTDSDPRVRSAALDGMFVLHQKGVKLNLSLYDAAVDALRDDFSSVRLGAMTLLWVLGHVYNSYVVLRSEGSDRQDLLMGDDGFAKTLDKNVMSHLRRKKTAHEERADKGAPGGIHPEGDQEFDPEEIAIMDSGACGAFVHGLEDEFYEVRSAALDAICELSAKSLPFGRRALDFLVDMFNDEIDDVRMNSMRCLRKISAVVEFGEEQVEIIVGVLDEDNPQIRVAIHALLGSLKLANIPCLYMVTTNLLSALKKYPNDYSSIWGALQSLGARHHVFVELMVEELLNLNPQFASTEADLALLYNAAAYNGNIIALCPAYTRAHYRYLRDQWPSYFNDVKVSSVGQSVLGGETERMALQKRTTDSNNTGEEQCLSQAAYHVRQALSLAHRGDYDAAQAVWESASRDLLHILEMSPRLLSLARFQLTYIRCLQALAKIQCSFNEGQGLGRGSMPAVARSARGLVRHTHQMENVYCGLGAQHIGIIRDLRLIGYVILLLAANQTVQTDSYEFKKRMEEFVQYAENAGRQRGDNWPLIEVISLAKQWAEDRSGGPNALMDMVINYVPDLPLVDSNIKNTHSRLSGGIGSLERPFQYSASVPVTLPVRGTMTNLIDPSRLRVQIMLGNGTVLIVQPPIGSLQPISAYSYRLSTDVPINLPACSDACTVQVRLALVYPPQDYLPIMNELE
eukprot:Ihof_evm4s365 gene=Ihof_evmTU4s365